MSDVNACRSTLLGFAALLVFVSGASAQEPFHEGARVRVFVTDAPRQWGGTNDEAVIGKIVGLNDTTLVLEAGNARPSWVHGGDLVLARKNLRSVEVSLRRSQRPKGALIGLLAGMATGYLVGLSSGDDPEGQWLGLSAEDKGDMLAVLGALVGAIAGAHVASPEVWQPVSLDRVRLGLGPMTGGTPGVLATIRF